MKTAAKIIASKLRYTEQEAIYKKPLTIEAMNEYGRQVAEAVREGMAPIGKANERANFDIE